MPNWCNNIVEIRGSSEKIKELEKFLDDNNGKDWFDFFAPCPQELKDVGNVDFVEKPNEDLVEKYGYGDWYSFGLGEWGCKWNCDAQGWYVDELELGESIIKFSFDSPWGPPEELYNNIQSEKYGEGWSVYAEWNEEGMQFVGYFDDGFGDTYEYSDLESLDGIPDFLVDNWNLRERMEDYENDEDEFDAEAELNGIIENYGENDGK